VVVTYSRSVQDALVERIIDCTATPSPDFEVKNIKDLSGAVKFFSTVTVRPEIKSMRVAIEHAKKAVSNEHVAAELTAQFTVFQKTSDQSLYGATLKKLGSDPRVLLRASSAHLGDSPQMFTSALCASCDGHRSVNCEVCYGTAMQKCTGCAGHGSYTCSCGGSGRVQKFENNRSTMVTCGSCGGAGSFVCRTCAGAGKYTCTTCNNGKVQCRPCDGDGTLVTAHWIALNADVTPTTYNYASLPWLNEVLKKGNLREKLVSDFKPVCISIDEGGVTGYRLKLECTAYTTDATLKYAGEVHQCRLIGRDRTVIEDGQVASKLFDTILAMNNDPHNVESIEVAARYPIAKRMIDELASGISEAELTDVKTNAVSPDQAHMFVYWRQMAFNAQKKIVRKIDLKLLPVRTLDYFLRLLPLMFIAMLYSAGHVVDKFTPGIWSLLTGNLDTVKAGLIHYLNIPRNWQTLLFLLVIGRISTHLFHSHLGLRFNNWIITGARGKATLVFTGFFVMLLSLFPDSPTTFHLFNIIPDFGMIGRGIKATVTAIPTLLVLSVMMAVMFNCSLNIPSTMDRLNRMGFKKSFIERNLLV
jgi:hypothetical protein